MSIIEKIIAVDIDDTLNNFSETLVRYEFVYKKECGVSKEIFNKWLPLVKKRVIVRESRAYLDFVLYIHRIVYTNAQAKQGAEEFMDWLKAAGYKIVIMTYRDLRYCLKDTKTWLEDNAIYYDYLFGTDQKITMCRKWQIPYLIDNDWKNILRSGWWGVQVFYEIADSNQKLAGKHAIGYKKMQEISTWLK